VETDSLAHMIPRLILRLLRLFALGVLHATDVQSLAAAAYADGWCTDNEIAQRLNRAGGAGRNRQHMYKAVIQAAKSAGLLAGLARPYVVRVPGPGGQHNDLQVYLPHEQLTYAILGNRAGLDEFCLTAEQLASDSGMGRLLREWGQHPDVDLDPLPDNVPILGLHCDGVTYTLGKRAGGQRSVVVGSLNVVSGRSKATRGQRHLFFIIGKGKLCDCGCSGFHSFNAIFEVLAWSMRCLKEGLSPNCRHDGSPFTPADMEHRLPPETRLPRAALLQIRGDWEWMTQCFRFRAAGNEHFCWLCDASKSGAMRYTDFRRNAPHRATLITHAMYLAALARDGQTPSTIFRCPGMQLKYVAIDAMHAGDLGTFQDALGSLFWCEITNKQWYRSKKIGLQSLNAQLKAFYEANADQGLTPLGPLVVSQIRSTEPGYPCLKSKAAQCRHAARFGLLLARVHAYGSPGRERYAFRAHSRLAGHTGEHCRLLVALFEGLVAFHDACAVEPFDPEACKSAMYTYLESLEGLKVLWRTGLASPDQHHGLPFWIRPKAHMLQHLVEEQVYIWGSPTLFWCYRDESFVGSVKTTCTSASRHPDTLEATVGEKSMLLCGVDHYERLHYGVEPDDP